MLTTSNPSQFRKHSQRTSLAPAAGERRPVRVITLLADRRSVHLAASSSTWASPQALVDDLELATWEDAEWR